MQCDKYYYSRFVARLFSNVGSKSGVTHTVMLSILKIAATPLAQTLSRYQQQLFVWLQTLAFSCYFQRIVADCWVSYVAMFINMINFEIL